MSLEIRARAAAETLRSATTVDAETGLGRLRRTHRRRSATRVAVSVAVVAGLVWGGVTVTLDEPDRSTAPIDDGRVEKLDPPPADNGIRGPVENGFVVHSIGGEDDILDTPPSELAPLTDAGTAHYPAWKAFDQDTGRFMFHDTASRGGLFDNTATVRILAPGLDTPVATIRCGQCYWPAFGPGPDEVTALISREEIAGEEYEWPPRTARVYGFDGVLRDEFDLPADLLEGSGIADLEWSPDGSRLAVSTFTGFREPDCHGIVCHARVWILDRAGGNPVLAYRQSMPPQAEGNPPLLQDLAWAPDGERLGLVSSTYYPERADPPTLVAIDVESGEAETLHEFDDCGACNPAPYGFAWSPDGTRIAVTSGAGIAQLAADGTVLVPAVGSERGPLAWLVKPTD